MVKLRLTPAAATVRRLVWEPLERELPPDTATVIIAPDGLLTAIPWSALPGDQPGAVLLDRYALATVPHAPFVLDLLTSSNRSADGGETLLGVGGLGNQGTEGASELDAVIGLAGTRKVVRLADNAATTTAVVSAVPGGAVVSFRYSWLFCRCERVVGYAPECGSVPATSDGGPAVALAEAHWSSRGWPCQRPASAARMGGRLRPRSCSLPKPLPVCRSRAWTSPCCRPARPGLERWPAARGFSVFSERFTSRARGQSWPACGKSRSGQPRP